MAASTRHLRNGGRRVPPDANDADAGSDAKFSDKNLAADGGLWFCSSFDPPQPSQPPYGWSSSLQACDGGSPSGLDLVNVKSAPAAFTTVRNPTCGSFLDYDLGLKGPRRPTITVVASVFSKDLPLAQGTETYLIEGVWNAGDAGPVRMFWILYVKGGIVTLRLARNDVTTVDLDIAPFTNNVWHDLAVTTVDGVTKSTTTPPRPATPPFFYVGPWKNIGGAASNLSFDDVAIYEP